MAEIHTTGVLEESLHPVLFAHVVRQLAPDYFPDHVAGRFINAARRLAIEYLTADMYVGNRGDYADDDAEFEEVLLSSAENDTTNYGVPASKSVVEKLETVVMEKAVECPICMEDVDAGETMTNLPCGHGYHGDCITTWLSARNYCPVCRVELPTDDEDYEKRRKMKELESNMSSTLNLS